MVDQVGHAGHPWTPPVLGYRKCLIKIMKGKEWKFGKMKLQKKNEIDERAPIYQNCSCRVVRYRTLPFWPGKLSDLVHLMKKKKTFF